MKAVQPLRVRNLRMTSLMAPEQYEGQLEDGRGIYIRERHEMIRVEISKKPIKEIDYSKWMKDAETIYDPSNFNNLLQFLQKQGIVKIPSKISKRIEKKRHGDFERMRRNIASGRFQRMLKKLNKRETKHSKR